MLFPVASASASRQTRRSCAYATTVNTRGLFMVRCIIGIIVGPNCQNEEPFESVSLNAFNSLLTSWFFSVPNICIALSFERSVF